MKIIGVDIDGVLADFNDSYRQVLFKVSGQELIAKGFEPPCWSYETVYGYTKDHVRAAWKDIEANPTFWRDLQPLDGAKQFLQGLYLSNPGKVYYITSRVGIDCKAQSEEWLRLHGPDASPTVYVCHEKGPLAKELSVTHFVDDKPENCFDIKSSVPSADVYMLSARYNGWAESKCREIGIHIIHHISQFENRLVNV